MVAWKALQAMMASGELSQFLGAPKRELKWVLNPNAAGRAGHDELFGSSASFTRPFDNCPTGTMASLAVIILRASARTRA